MAGVQIPFRRELQLLFYNSRVCCDTRVRRREDMDSLVLRTRRSLRTTMTEERRRDGIMFHASEIAAVAGRNRYQKRWQALCKVWRRHSRDTFDASGIVLPDERVDEIVRENADVGSIVSESTRARPHELEDFVHRAREVAESAGLSKSDVAFVLDRVRKESHCSHGTSEEPKTVGELASGSRPNISVDQKFVKRELGVLDDGTRAWIGGRLDATDDSKVVEIKNRVGGLRFDVPDYELPQVYAYMFIKGADSAVLVERSVLSDGTGMTCQHDVTWDSDEWGELRDELIGAARAVRALSSDDALARAFSESRTKDAFLTKLVTATK